MKTFCTIIKFLYVTMLLLGAINLIQDQIYVGAEDKVIVNRDELKGPSE